VEGGYGAGASAGFGAGASADYSASAGYGASYSASAGAATQSYASAGGWSTEAQFSELRTASSSASYSFDTSRVVTRVESASVSISSDAGFDLGGRAAVEGSASLNANVGANASLGTAGYVSASGRIRFED
jgi:hypothetical protein